MVDVDVAGAARLPAWIAVSMVLAAAWSTPAYAANRAPTIAGKPATYTYVGEQYSFKPSGADPEGATLRYTIQNKPQWAVFSTSTGRLSGAPGAPGLWNNISISVSDGVSSSEPLRFSVRARDRDNVPPVISGAPARSVAPGKLYSFIPSASDANGDPLRFSIANCPAWASFDKLTGQLSGTPGAASVGTYANISVSVSDGARSVALPAFSITVASSTNRAPTITGTPPTAATAGQAYSFRPVAADADKNALGFSIRNRPAWATFNTTTGLLSGTPGAAHVGAYSNIVIEVSDGKASAALAPFAIRVTAVTNKKPTISGLAAPSVNAGSAYVFRPQAADGDGDPLKFSIANRPAWASFNATTGQLSGTPASASVGTYANIVISVSDGKASTALGAFSITVADVSRGSASLEWLPPTQNLDGSALTNLAGYRIVYGTSASQLTQTIEVANAGMSSYVVDDLAPGTYYFAVRAYTRSGAESANSNVMPRVVQ
ncbi:MAG TPA: putative Ig domain-containing protein [Steroidobacteraceae bacterium]|nr:putative Ig domain-containing protein [Steroidobacteraceae bacterium]